MAAEGEQGGHAQQHGEADGADHPIHAIEQVHRIGGSHEPEDRQRDREVAGGNLPAEQINHLDVDAAGDQGAGGQKLAKNFVFAGKPETVIGDTDDEQGGDTAEHHRTGQPGGRQAADFKGQDDGANGNGDRNATDERDNAGVEFASGIRLVDQPDSVGDERHDRDRHEDDQEGH